MNQLETSVREWVLRTPGGQELTLRLKPGESATVGRDLTCELPLLDAGVSRHHATVSLEGDDLWLEDLHSQNGTFVNTEPVFRVCVHAGDVITFGRVPLTLSARALGPSDVDPLLPLSRGDLTSLLRMARVLVAEKRRSALFQKLVDLTRSSLQAERGTLLLWEEAGKRFYPSAASPQRFLQEASHFLSSTLPASILEDGRARLFSEPVFAGAASAAAAPLFAGQKPLGLLYLDRVAGQPAFQASDADFLFAVAWLTSNAFRALPDTAESVEGPLRGQRGDGPGPQRLRGIEAVSTAPWRPPSGEVGLLLDELDDFLGRPASSAPSRRLPLETPPPDKGAARKLRLTRLAVEALRRLRESPDEICEENPLSRLMAEISGLDQGLTSYRVEEGWNLSVVANSRDLVLALRLATGCLLADSSAAPVVAVAASQVKRSGAISIRLSCGAAGDGSKRLDAGLPGRLARQIVEERLRGKLLMAEDGSAVDVRLPEPAAALGDTVMLGGERPV